eukprot:363781_1
MATYREQRKEAHRINELSSIQTIELSTIPDLQPFLLKQNEINTKDDSNDSDDDTEQFEVLVDFNNEMWVKITSVTKNDRWLRSIKHIYKVYICHVTKDISTSSSHNQSALLSQFIQIYTKRMAQTVYISWRLMKSLLTFMENHQQYNASELKRRLHLMLYESKCIHIQSYYDKEYTIDHEPLMQFNYCFYTLL